MPNPASQKFDKPTILVLRPAYELNEGKDVSAPRLDALDHGLHLTRQAGDGEAGMVWNAEDFAEIYGLDGKAILGALVNDKSAVRGMDMLDTFVKGHSLPMVYVRGSGKFAHLMKNRGDDWADMDTRQRQTSARRGSWITTRSSCYFTTPRINPRSSRPRPPMATRMPTGASTWPSGKSGCGRRRWTCWASSRGKGVTGG